MIAIIILLFLIFAIYKREIRHSLAGVLKCFFKWKILLPVALMLLYICCFVWLFYKVNLWDWSLLKDTIFWAGAALVMLFNYERIGKDLKKYLKDQFGLIIILEFVAGFYAFNIIGELILVPFVIFLSMMNAVAATKKEWLPVKKLTDGLIATIGIYILLFAISRMIGGFRTFATIHTLETFLLPIIFTLIFLPFIYVVALFAEYEMLFVRLEHVWFKNNKSLIKYAKRQVFKTCLLNLRKVKNLSAKSAFAFMEVKDKAGVIKAIIE